ncbi:MAG: SIR2 family protein, partial [Sphingobium sp.]
MESITSPSELSSDDFVRRFALRPGQLMWLLGAGASVSAGIPSAWDMIWQFKQTLFVAQRKASPQSVADLGNPAIRALLDSHIASSERLPSPGSPDEYAALFEATYPVERDRTTFIQGMISGAKLAYGHLALASLLKAGHTQLVWTTNFDHLIEDACARTYGTTGTLSVVALDAPELAGQLIGAQKWPIAVKLHGDFRSRRLKNTTDELRQQDAAL